MNNELIKKGGDAVFNANLEYAERCANDEEEYSDDKWACDKLGWHIAPKIIGFDGCSNNGECPRCKKFVMQDSQGNWF